MNPLQNNPLRTRQDLQNAVRQILAPLEQHTSSAGAWVIPGASAAAYGVAGTGLEGFARRLWGLAPLAAGGGAYDGWARVREGLAAGTDPSHPEYWGDPGNIDVRLVEMASLGFGLALARAQLWDPLPDGIRRNVERYLSFASQRTMCDNNWKFFTVLGNLGLETCGCAPNSIATQAALDRLEEMYLDSGWYRDGLTLQRDYYISFAMHFYGLLYSRAARSADPALLQRYRERGAIFAKDFAHWFTDQGPSLPFGRSLTYRFAQASFWAALAYAGVEALPWGVIKGILLRHLRWWATQPIWTDSGALSIGYGYPNLIMAEEYNAPGSPYWALKSFLPLALPEDHPFWQAEELPMPPMDAVRVMPHAGMVVCRDAQSDHVVALSGGQCITTWSMRHSEQKYGKFAYSTAFGFCIDAGQKWHDNMLCFSEDGRRWTGRIRCTEHRIEGNELISRWEPMPGVEVETRLRPEGRGHVREHRIRTERKVQTVEAGFAGSAGAGDIVPGRDTEVGDHWAQVRVAELVSTVRDLTRTRTPAISTIEPNVNLLHARTLAPLLRQTLAPGTHEFATEVVGLPLR